MFGFGVGGAGLEKVDLSDSYLDSFGRLVTVQPTELGSFDHRLGKLPRYWDEVLVGGATSTHNALTVSVDATVGTGSTDSVIRQTYRCFEYIRGNAQIGKFSLNPGGAGVANNERLWGFGDDQNGVFWGIDGNGLKAVLRTFTSGVTVNHTVYQQNFNLDRLDGTGPSGINIDLGKQNLFLISYSWLGTNVIQLRIAYQGKQIPVHTFNSGNESTVAWCRSGSLPLHIQNKNTDTTTASVTMKIGCTAVFSAGSSKDLSTYQSVSSGINSISFTATPSVGVGIRLRPDTNYLSIVPDFYSILTSGGTTALYYKIIFRPTLTGAIWANFSDVTQVLTNTPTYVANSGYVLQEGHIALGTANTRVSTSFASTLNSYLGYAIDGTPDALIILLQATSGTGSIYFSGSFKEVF